MCCNCFCNILHPFYYTFFVCSISASYLSKRFYMGPNKCCFVWAFQMLSLFFIQPSFLNSVLSFQQFVTTSTMISSGLQWVVLVVFLIYSYSLSESFLHTLLHFSCSNCFWHEKARGTIAGLFTPFVECQSLIKLCLKCVLLNFYSSLCLYNIIISEVH